MGRTKLPRTLESNSRDPLSAAKPYMYAYIYIVFGDDDNDENDDDDDDDGGDDDDIPNT